MANNFEMRSQGVSAFPYKASNSFKFEAIISRVSISAKTNLTSLTLVEILKVFKIHSDTFWQIIYATVCSDLDLH